MNAITETYEDVRNLGKSLARQYSGVDISYDEALTHFDDAFLDAYFGGWKTDGKACFSTWVKIKTYYRILDCRVKTRQRLERVATIDDLDWVVDPSPFNEMEEAESEERNIYQVIDKGDARRILTHIAANRDLYLDLSRTHDGVKQARKSIRAYLKKTYGWTPVRICAAMRKVTHYLKDPKNEQQ